MRFKSKRSPNKQPFLQLNTKFFNWYNLRKQLQINTKYFSISLLTIDFRRLSNNQRSLYMKKNANFAEYSIGDFSYGQPTVLKFTSEGTLKIGKFCSFSDNVIILLDAAGAHRPDWITTYPFIRVFKDFQQLPFPKVEKSNVTIGNDVWVGYNSTIMSGVNIGDGAVIGASSVVTKDVPPYSIFAGNPAKLIRMRFSPKIIEGLLKIQWWNWDLKRIKDNAPLLLSNNIEEFINKNL